MGNIIGIDENFGNLKKHENKPKVPLTATGRFSTPNLMSSALRDISRRGSEKKNSKSITKRHCNSIVIKDIFPPLKSGRHRNTVSPGDFDRGIQYSSDETKEEITEETEKIIKRYRTETMPNLAPLMKKDSCMFMSADDESIEEIIKESSYLKPNDYELNFLKTGEDIRRSYIAKLIYKKVWTPTVKEKNHNSLIIFDWDDTLLCTSFLTPNGVYSDDVKIPEKDFEKLKKLEECAATILKLAINKGDTYIITNAAPGWVQYSANKFYPEVAKLLDKVTIVSARGEYEKRFPGDSRQWKILAFLEMQKTLDMNLVTNLLCLGDSIIEMEAAHILASKFSHAYIKTVKFRECPKPEELHKQLNLVIDQFSTIFSAVKNLTIRVEKKSKERD